MMTTPATHTNSAAPVVSAAPWYSLEAVQQTATGYEGLLRVLDAADLPAAMAHWKDKWAGYEPRIVADSVDPCLAKWSRWNTCE
jgi:hypothetical protein